VALTIGNEVTILALPDGLIWEDELAWDTVVQATTHSLDGALVIEEWTRLAGRPITLAGGERWAWIARSDLLALQALGAPAGAVLTLTLHDARAFTVTPRRDEEGWLVVRPLPVVLDSGPADPSGATRYQLERIRLLQTPP
jgi:hypothetical protein